MVTQDGNGPDLVAGEAIPSSDVTRVRFSEIDGLRAVAIVAAVVYEVTRIASPLGTWPPALARLFADLSQGIPLFFLLSGFVLAYPPLATLRQDGRTYLDVGRYLVKRLLRIYPAYLVVLALTFLVPPLALQYGLPALANGSGPLTRDLFFANLFFVGDGLGNDAFRALILEARWLVLFPAALALWARWPRAFLALIALAACGDAVLPAAHAAGLAALVPFMLGIVAADLRAGHHRLERFGFVIAGVAAILAVLLDHVAAGLPGPAGAPGALRFDPLWSVALFGLLVGAGTSTMVERTLSVRPLRFLGAASYGIALVTVPVSAFVVRQTAAQFGPAGSAINAAVVSLLAGCVIWQLSDRWFAEGTLRRDIAAVVGPWLDAALRFARIDRVTLGAPPVLKNERSEDDINTLFYAPPPRRESGELAIVETHSGSPEQLAAEIMETKRRLADRTAVIFGDARESAEPEVQAAPATPAHEKPGFYRRMPPKAAPVEVSAQIARPAQAAPKAASPASAPAPAPRPVEPAAAPRPAAPGTPEPAYREQLPITVSFEAPPYEHFALETPAPPAPPVPKPVAPQPASVAQGVAPAARPAPPAAPPAAPVAQPVRPAAAPAAPAPKPQASPAVQSGPTSATAQVRPPAPVPAPAPPPGQRIPAATAPAPVSRGPIKIRIATPAPQSPHSNGNGNGKPTSVDS